MILYSTAVRRHWQRRPICGLSPLHFQHGRENGAVERCPVRTMSLLDIGIIDISAKSTTTDWMRSCKIFGTRSHVLVCRMLRPVDFWLSYAFFFRCRSVVKPTDITRFDEKVSPQELRTLCETLSDAASDDDGYELDDTMDTKDGIF